MKTNINKLAKKIASMKELRKKGWTLERIAKRFKCSDSNVSYHLCKSNDRRKK